MNLPNSSTDSVQALKEVVAAVRESRARMNSYTDEQKVSLEIGGRARMRGLAVPDETPAVRSA
jgi:hypothetical protein